MRNVKILVSGHVQGVYFRASAQKQAQAWGITGQVRNLADGRVEIIACAKPEVIEKLIKWCQHGPTTAKVEKVDVSDLANPDSFQDFSIK